MQPALPENLVRQKKLLQCEVVCDGLVEAWKGVKFGCGRDKALATRGLKATMISLDDI